MTESYEMMEPYKGWEERRMATSFLLHQILQLQNPYVSQKNTILQKKFEIEKFGVVDRLIYHFSESFGRGARSGYEKYKHIPLWSIKAYNKYRNRPDKSVKWIKDNFILEHPVARSILKKHLCEEENKYNDFGILRRDLNIYGNAVVVTTCEDRKLGSSKDHNFQDDPWKRYYGKVKLCDHKAIPPDVRKILPCKILHYPEIR